ncbi:MAG: cardiolipin synthase ClsB [Betaproteobacteria bacterium]|nr:cardiolipin synthase ClsB [Betaproteobacteria bacterium]
MRFRDGNSLDLLSNGEQYFPALEREIDAAASEIYLETYIFEADATGDRIAQALIRAALRGVAVCLLVDGFGSRLFAQNLQPRLLEAGVQSLVFRPESSLFKFRRTRLRRLHRKLVVIDGKVGFCGGINVIDDVHAGGPVHPRFDYAVRVQGPLLADMHAAVRAVWMRAAWTNMRRRWAPPIGPRPDAPPAGDRRAAFLARDNFRHRHDIERAYLAAIRSAKFEVVIANAYFLPGKRFRRALLAATHRGVRVVLLLQGRVEYLLVHYATRALYHQLLDAGVEIHEYQRSFLHAKVAVIDGRWATVGSSNIDPVSLLLAREANVVVENQAFASDLRDSLQSAIASGAKPVAREYAVKMGVVTRLMTWIAYGLLRILTGISSYGRARDFL